MAVRPISALSNAFALCGPTWRSRQISSSASQAKQDQDFEDTLDLIRQVNFAQAYSFKYSERPGTPAAEHKDQVPEAVKSERLQRLQALLNEQQLAFNEAMADRIVPVLFDRRGKKPGQLVGRSPWLQATHIDLDPVRADALFGAVSDVRVARGAPNGLVGSLADPKQESAA